MEFIIVEIKWEQVLQPFCFAECLKLFWQTALCGISYTFRGKYLRNKSFSRKQIKRNIRTNEPRCRWKKKRPRRKMADREYSARLLRVRARKKAIAPRWPGYLPNSALILHHSLSQGTLRRIPETRNLSSLTDGGAFPSATRIATSSSFTNINL